LYWISGDLKFLPDLVATLEQFCNDSMFSACLEDLVRCLLVTDVNISSLSGAMVA
jgi:hypothetical protein